MTILRSAPRRRSKSLMSMTTRNERNNTRATREKKKANECEPVAGPDERVGLWNDD
jgi:hypothetical protein